MTNRQRELEALTENMLWTVQQIEHLLAHLSDLERHMLLLGVATDARMKMRARMEENYGFQESCQVRRES